jgi:hypothetical protein
LEKIAEFLLPDQDCEQIFQIKLVSVEDHLKHFKNTDLDDSDTPLPSHRRVIDDEISLIYVLTDSNLYIVCHDLEDNKFEQIAKINWKVKIPTLEDVVFQEFTIYKNSVFLANFDGEPQILKISFGDEIVARKSTYREPKVEVKEQPKV